MISGISNLQGYADINKPIMEHATHQVAQQNAPISKDSVSINPAAYMTDEEAAQILQEATEEITASTSEALSVHQGLDYSRVMALLGDI